MNKSIKRFGILATDNSAELPVVKATQAEGFLFLAGQMAFDVNGVVVGDTIAKQTIQTFKNIESVLNEAGYQLEDLVRCTCYIKNEEDFNDFNRAYAKLFKNIPPPARSTIPSKLLLNALVEIEATAYKKQ